MTSIFITGIGTNVGKTVVSAIVCEALQADYWKPVQSGTDEGRDADTVSRLISNSKTVIHPSVYELQLPASPNIAANAENVTLDIEKIIIPETENDLIIEGAGGLLVPLTNDKTYLDFVLKHRLSVIVVISSYLGCINHSLLTFSVLKQHNIPVVCAILNGNFDGEVKKTLQHFINVPFIEIEQNEQVDKDFVSREAKKVRNFFS